MSPNTTERIDEIIKDTQNEDAIRAFFADLISNKEQTTPSAELRARVMEAAKNELTRSTPSHFPSPYFNFITRSVFSSRLATAGALATVLIIASGIPFISKTHGNTALRQASVPEKIQVTAVEHNAEIDAALASIDSEAGMDDVGQLDDNDWESSHIPDIDNPEGARGHEIDTV